MGSNQKQTRQRQQQELQLQLTERKKLLAEKGVDEVSIRRDKVFQHLQAELKRTRRAIAVITARKELMQEIKQQRQDRVSGVEPKGQKPKKQKSGSADREHNRRQGTSPDTPKHPKHRNEEDRLSA